jgi:membrane protein
LVVGKFDLVDIGRRLLDQIKRDDVAGLAAELSYRFFFAIFPFFIFLAALSGFVAGWLGLPNPTATIIGYFNQVLPPAAASLILPQIEFIISEKQPGLLSIGAVLAIWAATGGTKAIMKAMNRAYGIAETRRFLRANLTAVGLTLVASLLVVIAFALLLAGQVIGPGIAESLGLGALFGWFLFLLGWLVPIALVGGTLLLIYRFAPSKKLAVSQVMPGTVLCAVAWAVATSLFALYVARFSNYNATYGALGGIIVLLLWFYITSFILLVGAKLNAILAEQAKDEGTEHR